MTRQEAELELAELRFQIARLQGRKAELQLRLMRGDDDNITDLLRPGWPIRRSGQVSARRISISSPSRIAV
jgi:hypothetical protein